MKDSSTATERVGRYQLLEPIGAGPSGAVARAKVFGVAGFERQFAVKRFLAELTAGPAAQALSSAARSYGSLEHPRIARMSEFGVAQGQTFTAVEYVAGLDVFRLLQEAKLASVAIAAGGALALVSQAARAVGYAHGRGLSHLGLSPTNVIVTADGDVKVTDFGILAATMPPRPAESPRLASRIPYLAPEQIAGEATSAATDVFVLGVLAYELVTGQRAYRGDSPAAVAQAILAGPPIEPALPRPIVRVLQRCLARSPFERFPDARALADALDAALRVAPVPGTRKDVGAQVKTTLERYAQLNEGNVSGMVALGSNIAPSDEVSTQPLSRRPEARTEPSPMPTFPAATHTDLPKPTATMTGLAPPPIPVPPGVGASSPALVPPGTIPKSTSTIPGLSPATKPGVPAIPRIGATPPKGPPSRPSPPPLPPKPGALTQGWDAMPDPEALAAAVPAKVGSLTQGWDAMPEPAAGPASLVSGPATIPDPIASVTDEPVFELPDEPSAPAARDGRRPTPHSFDSATGEMSTDQLDMLNKRAQLSTSEMAPVQQPAQQPPHNPHDAVTKPVGVAAINVAVGQQLAPSPGPTARDSLGDSIDPPPYSGGDIEPAASSTMPGLAPPPKPSSQPSISVPGMAPAAASRPEPAATAVPARPMAPAQPTKLPLIAGIVLGVGVLGAAGFFAYKELTAKKSDDTTTVAMGSGSAVADSSGSAAVETPGSAAAGSATGSAPGSAAAGSALEASGSTGSGSDSTGSGDATGSAAAGSASDGSAGSAQVAAGSGDGSAQTAAGSGDGSAQAGSGAGSNVATNDGGNTSATPAQPSDQLEVVTTPPGARVFLDGAELGKSPMKQPGSADRHTLAVLLPGHALYLAEIDGSGIYNVTLDPVKLPRSGPGIKIETCKAKNRYYIYVDGQPSGQTCPTTKRIVVNGLGPHTVEVYDIVTEARKKYDVDIKNDRLSARVRIDE